MIDTARQRIDLHVHSRHSGTMRPAVLQRLEVGESYTEPETIHERMLERGMSMVTITDHDRIDGCLEIMHHGSHVFISEEVSAHYPGTGCVLHVLVYGITEVQHDEIQRLRFNIFDLVAYLRGEGIVHVWAHPFSLVTYEMTPDLLRQSFLLFDNVELINGQKDPGHERLLREVLRQLDSERLEEWAARYDIEPAPLAGRWGLTAGSDDHSGFTLGRAFVEFEGEATLPALLEAIRDRRTRPNGLEKTASSYAHTAYAGTINFLMQAHPTGSRQSIGRIVDLVQAGRMPSEDELDPLLQRLLPAVFETVASAGGIPSPDRLVSEGHHRDVHDELFRLFSDTMVKAFQASFGRIREAVEAVDLEAIIDEVPTLIRLALFNGPYYFGLNYFHGERRRARTLYSWLELDDSVLPAPRVAIFGDTLEHLSGVSLGLRRAVEDLRANGHDIWLCGPETRPEGERAQEEGVVRFPSLATFPLPGYTDMSLGLPSLLEVMRWLDEQRIDLVQVSTPGPAGWVARLAARVLGIPAIGYFHTDVPAFARLLLNDVTLDRLVAGFVGAFYSTFDEVLVPTRAAAGVVAELGVPADRLRVVDRGVDLAGFHPEHRRSGYWRQHGLDGLPVLSYVGRISVEKNLPFLQRVLGTLAERGVPFAFAAIGDGPYRAAFEAGMDGVPAAFTGFLEGEELARAIASSDLLLFPSETETFGNAVMECYASGVPAIVSDRGGPSEFTLHDRIGWIVPADDAGRWADRVQEVLADTASLRRVGHAARRAAEERPLAGSHEGLWRTYETFLARQRERLGERAC